jgi:hypothetical protein
MSAAFQKLLGGRERGRHRANQCGKVECGNVEGHTGLLRCFTAAVRESGGSRGAFDIRAFRISACLHAL